MARPDKPEHEMHITRKWQFKQFHQYFQTLGYFCVNEFAALINVRGNDWIFWLRLNHTARSRGVGTPIFQKIFRISILQNHQGHRPSTGWSLA
jgi:hypothetical protein